MQHLQRQVPAQELDRLTVKSYTDRIKAHSPPPPTPKYLFPEPVAVNVQIIFWLELSLCDALVSPRIWTELTYMSVSPNRRVSR